MMKTDIMFDDEIKINETTYKIGDFVAIFGYSPEGHQKVIRIDKILYPHLPFVVEYDNEKLLHSINSAFIIRHATKEEIEAEFDFRNKQVLLSTFHQRPEYNFTFDWGLVHPEILKSLNFEDVKLYKVDLYVYESNGEFCITTQSNKPLHDGHLSFLLNLTYIEYISILLRFNGEPKPLLKAYQTNDYHHSTHTWFKNREDCENCIKYIKSKMV